MSFLYFLPDERGNLSYELLRNYGLCHIVDTPSQPLHCRQVLSNHPSGQPGMIIAAADRCEAETVKQSPEVEWVKFPANHATKQAWLGWLERPKQADLIRKSTIPGEYVTLPDGDQWLVPIARHANGQCALPIVYDLDDETGKWVPSKVRRDCERVWKHATKCLNAMCAGDGEFLIDDFESMVADVMACNYRVSLRELAVLDLLDSSMANTLVSVLLDFNGFNELQPEGMQ